MLPKWAQVAQDTYDLALPRPVPVPTCVGCQTKLKTEAERFLTPRQHLGPYCATCFNLLVKTCAECNAPVNTAEDLTLLGATYCQPCQRKLIYRCNGCNVYYKLPVAITDTQGHGYCAGCAERHLRPCRVCGGKALSFNMNRSLTRQQIWGWRKNGKLADEEPNVCPACTNSMRYCQHCRRYGDASVMTLHAGAGGVVRAYCELCACEKMGLAARQRTVCHYCGIACTPGTGIATHAGHVCPDCRALTRNISITEVQYDVVRDPGR